MNMRMPTLFAALAVSLSACATAGPAPMVEQGYQRGALGVAAINRGDWQAAEAQLLDVRGMRADDPARLINLGKVYMATGRPGMALSAWRLALASDRHFTVETVDGKLVSTEELARRALAQHDRAIRSATR